ncbi:hypothetical protein [Desulfotignum balticum]|uniref:hypothetical protein n=1 Tax=Desulfotignum balticum TaxID=115781 RepID=UPI00040C1DC4|nr:hypothetical protein [Desulfotignum balticum]
MLQEQMAAYAGSKGIRGFKAHILCENAAMIRLAKRCGSRVTFRKEGDVYNVEMFF